MRFSFSHKLFAGFSLLSLLTILLGVTTFTTINEITRSQRNLALLQEFELRVNTLEAAANAQSNIAFISAKSYEDFRENLDRTRQVANEILHSDYCESGPNPDGADSCQSIMLEAMNLYPRAAIEHYEKTLSTLRLINQNHFIYRKMLEAEKPRPEKIDHSQISSIINQLEMLKHEFEESNDFAAIEEMKSRFELLRNLDPNPELLDLAEKFIANSERTYRNRLGIMATREGLAETTAKFRVTAQTLLEDVVSGGKQNEQEVRALIMFLGIGSIALTLLFWLLTSSRLARFLKNQKKAINSIRTGHYDYPVEKDTNDELHELYLFTKDLAENLKEEIAEREFSQQGKKDLEFQLMQAQRLESIGILAGGIAHDFNNVLTGITGYTELAMARLDDNHPVKKYLETIADSGQKAVEMTRQLLVFSHKQETAKRVINLKMLISNLMKMLDRMIGEDIVLELDSAPDLPAVMADPVHIEHVLLNLAVIAKDAMPGGGKLTVRTSTAILEGPAVDELVGVDPGNFVLISITDNGPGMPEEVQKKIFEPFYTTKANNRESGLGLATVFGIIKQHNGHISVESTVGRGTTFNLYLPAIDYEQQSEAAESAPSDQAICRGRETILLVDDNDTARDFVCETLEYCGYKVLTASSGSEAVKIMNQANYPIDLLLTDIIMPGMNGMELAVKTRQVHPGIKVIFMSGYDELPVGHQLAEMVENRDLLKKPMSLEGLSRKVREVLDR